MLDELQTEDFPEPDQQLTIRDLETLRVISDPLRVQILESMIEGATTVKSLASKLDTTPTKLYYHINLLEEHGLIKVVGTRVVSGIIEKQYQVAAKNIEVDRGLLGTLASSGNDDFDKLLSTVFDSVRTDIMKSLKAGLIDMQ